MNRKDLNSYFSKVSSRSTKESGTVAAHVQSQLEVQSNQVQAQQRPQEQETAAEQRQQMNEGIKEFNPDHIIADPGLRIPLDDFHPDIRDQVRRAYLLKGPTQPIGHNYPRKTYGKDLRAFRESWYKKHDWLEYSVAKDAAYCFYCFLFKHDPLHEQFGHDVFTKIGYSNWKNQYKSYADHVGGVSSIHNNARKACDEFKNQRSSVSHKIMSYSKESEIKYEIRVTASLDCASFLLRQGQSFRGHDESSSSLNKGNFLEMIDWYKERKEEVKLAFDELCPANAQMTCPKIQKQLAKCCAQEVTKVIKEEIGNGLFSILIDESRDISIKEQMAVIVRFVNNKGKVIERFLGVQHVTEVTSDALKRALIGMLGAHGLPITRLRGQGYDGASNMRGEFNGLQKLIRDENPYAFYVHCFAHRLQLVVVAVTSCYSSINDFFEYVTLIVTTTSASCKRKDVLLDKHRQNILDKLESGEIFSGRGKHQETSLARPGDTRWGSHYATLIRIETMWDAVTDVLGIVHEDGRNPSKAAGLLHIMETFNFVFILKMMLKVLRITNELSLVLQRKDQNIVLAMSLLVDVKTRLTNLRNHGWEPLFTEVKKFCDENKIPVPNMDEAIPRWGRSRKGGITVTQDHHYRVDTFFAAIDAIITEMDHRFNEVSSELLVCFSCLDPRDSFSKFNVDKIARLADIYDEDFSISDRAAIKDQLETFILHVRRIDDFVTCHDIGSLAVKLVETERHIAFPLVYRLIELALLLPVATASVERAFSAMNIIKTDLRNKMSDDWLNDLMVCYIEREIFKGLDREKIKKRFQDMKTRRMKMSRSPRRT